MPSGASLRRVSADATRHREDESSDLQRAALEKIHAKRLAEKSAVLVQGPHGWQLVKLKKLDATSRALLLSTVYRQSEDESLGFFARINERLER